GRTAPSDQTHMYRKSNSARGFSEGRSCAGMSAASCRSEVRGRRGRPGAAGAGAVRVRGSVLAREPAGDGRLGVLVDVLGLGVLLETGGAQLAADARLLETAPLRLRQVGVEVVDPDGAVAQAPRDPVRGPGVRGPHRAGQAVLGVVGDRDRLLFGG